MNNVFFHRNQAAGDVLRPRYLNWKFLIEEWACGHCKDVLTEPMQTKCGVRYAIELGSLCEASENQK